MAANPADFLGALLSVLPLLQYFVFFVFTLTYGRIAVIGYRTHSPWFVKVLVFFGTGLFSLFCGISLSGIIVSGADPVTNLLKILMLDVFASGLVCSVIVALGVFLISRNIYNTKGIKKSIENLEERLKKAEHASETPLARRLAGPTMTAGCVLLFGLLAYSFMNFHGVPTYSDRVSSAIGIPLEDLQGLAGSVEGLGPLGSAEGGGSRPDECASLSGILLANANELMGGGIPEYVSPGVKSMIESRSGSSVQVMFRVQENGGEYAVAMTGDNRVCSVKLGKPENIFCECMELSLPF